MDVTADGNENYVIGVDYGTLSGRAVVVRVRDGKELGSGVFDYPHAVVTEALPAHLPGALDELPDLVVIGQRAELERFVEADQWWHPRPP